MKVRASIRLLLILLLAVIPIKSNAQASALLKKILDAPQDAAQTQALISIAEDSKASRMQQYEHFAMQKIENEKNWLQRLKEFSENHLYQAQSLEQLTNQLLTQKASLETARDVFRVGSSFFKESGVLLEAYDTVDEIIDDVSEIKNRVSSYKGYRVWQDGRGINVVNPLYSLGTLADETLGEVYDIISFLKNQILSPDNKLTYSERLEEIRKGLQRLRGYHSLLQSVIANMKAVENSRDFTPKATIATGNNGDRTSDEMNAFNAKVLLGNATDHDAVAEWAKSLAMGEKPNFNASVSRGKSVDKSNEEKPFDKKSAGATFVNALFLAISVLALLFFGWNFFVVNHGDKQRMDALWKVAAGYVIMAVFLQLFKAMFF